MVAAMRRGALALALLLARSGSEAQTSPTTPVAVAPVVEGAVPRSGFDLHYRVLGASGPYLVVLSGGPGEEVRSMQEVCDELRKSHRCILLEQRGTGRSRLRAYDATTINLAAYVDDLEALRRHLGLERLTLFGNSWGMMLALAYGGSHPERVRGIVAAGSGPITAHYLSIFVDNQRSRLPPESRRVVEFWSDAKRRQADPERATFERTRATAPAYFYDQDKAFVFAQEIPADEFNPNVVPAFLKAEGQFDLRPLLRRIQAPALLLQGRQDLAGEANLIEAHELVHGSRLEWIDRCGHMPWLEQPAQTWKIVEEFLAGLGPE